jgi:GGDEF domain-containing protein
VITVPASDTARPDEAAADHADLSRGGMTLAHHTVPLAASIGLAVTDAGDTDPHALLSAADVAMYRAKHTGRTTPGRQPAGH